MPSSTPPARPNLPPLLAAALAARAPLIAAPHNAPLRLFAGFYEGAPDLVADLYADTLVLHNYAQPAADGAEAVRRAAAFYRAELAWLRCVVVKHRHATDRTDRHGVLLAGDAPVTRVVEDGVRYAIDVMAARDAGFYLDTRAVRDYLRREMAGRTVLNTFAYTGSLGVAAMAGGAERVVQLDVSRPFLSVAKTSYTLNGLPIRRADFIAADFWVATSRMRRQNQQFDCVILDPPFFAAAATGTIDLANEADRLINKVRPLVADGGRLIVINNALFLSGAAHMHQLEGLCASGFLKIERRIDVPDDITGYATTRVGAPPVDPAPFNHPTKIVVLGVRR